MLKKTFSFTLFSLLVFSSFLSAKIEYEIHDIGTLQTHSSQAIALNNKGQILGWYNVDGSESGKHYFLRDKEGSFHEIPGQEIAWAYLTNDGKVYGTSNNSSKKPTLYMWDYTTGLVKLGTLPGNEIAAINDAGQVLIKSVSETQNGKSIIHPVIWENEKVTKLKGLEGDLGIQSEELYGFDMNNHGEVVGQSVVYLIYKNNICKHIHAVKWVNEKPIDLHYTVPKQEKTVATAINDNGNVLINRHDFKLNNIDYIYSNTHIAKMRFTDGVNQGGSSFYGLGKINTQIVMNFDTIWLSAKKIISVNDKGEIIVEGETIYGEKHAMFLTPVEEL